jgi:Flp pilus assembly protein TadB
MKTVELVPARAKNRKRTWLLELDEDEVRLLDDRDELVLTMPRDEANRRIMFPSFWMSVKYLQIFDERQRPYEFEAEKRARDPIQAYLDRVLRQDAGARGKLRASGWGMLVLGVFLLIAGAALLTYLIVTNAFISPGRLRIASPFAAILMGLVFTFWGIFMIRRAARLGREGEEFEDASE